MITLLMLMLGEQLLVKEPQSRREARQSDKVRAGGKSTFCLSFAGV